MANRSMPSSFAGDSVCYCGLCFVAAHIVFNAV
jgi:hypothetical protein